MAADDESSTHDMKLLLMRPSPRGASGIAPRHVPRWWTKPKTLCYACDIMNLSCRSTGTVMAFQALAPSFSNHGICGTASRYLTVALIGACAASCLLLSFTDSLVGHDGRFYYGMATPRGFYPFNFDGTCDERSRSFANIPRKKIKALDFVHALVSAVLYMVVALGNAGIQNCLFPDIRLDVREVLMNLPVGSCPAWCS